MGFSSLRQALGCKIPLQGVHTNLSNLSAPPPPKKAGYIFPNLPLYIVRGNSRHVLAAGRCQPIVISFRQRNEQKRSMHPVNDYQTITEFRGTLASLAPDGPTRPWKRQHFLAEVPAPAESKATEYWACAHDNGLTLGIAETERNLVQALFAGRVTLLEPARPGMRRQSTAVGGDGQVVAAGIGAVRRPG